jgi:heme oxygenase
MAFLHIRDELAKNNISFVYIHMPMDSLRVATIPQSTKTNYFNFLNSTGVRYYNLEQAYPDGELYDLVHLNKFGREKFSRNLADLLIKGLL